MLTIEQWGTLFFLLAVLHTFITPVFRRWSHQMKPHSAAEGLFHLLGEIEVVFGFWAALFFVLMSLIEGLEHSVQYLESLNFTEPLFVFVIMAMCSTRPVLSAARSLILFFSRLLQKVFRLPLAHAEVFAVLTLGPLSGSFITEPAAMTVAALLLLQMIRSEKPVVLYGLLGVLFVNVSIGGALTPYAAPPILMVAKTWGWDAKVVFEHFAWKVMLAVVINAAAFIFYFRKNLSAEFLPLRSGREERSTPIVVTIFHFLFLVGVIVFAHHQVVFLSLFLFFLGLFSVTKGHQQDLRLRESLLVAFFLGGIIFFGPFQIWWLKPLLSSLGDSALFFGATALTAVTDNAALTYLGSQVEGLSDLAKYALVAGALAGGGLTVIANAPNPAGYSLLQKKFPRGEIGPWGLLAGAAFPTLVAVLCLWFLHY